ncbi:MAG: DUF1015 domain-containing protein [Planctomycetota bacterium]
MSIIRPLRAIRYNTDRASDVSSRLAPPYDVVSEAEKQALLAGDECNFVKIDLPHTPPKAAGPPEVYQDANETLLDWLARGVMVQDEQPAIYVYHQLYRYGDVDYTRKMFFARLRLEAFGSRSVFPHEKTFGGPKEDRLCLTKATKANLSPIFGLYEDTDNEVAQSLEQALPPEPLASGTLNEIKSRIWAVTDERVIAEVARLMQPRPIYIADGHHRYGTGMLHRDWLIERQGPLPADHPANFVLCVFCAMEDPGLLILPTHRVLSGIEVSREFLTEDDNLTIEQLSVTGPEKAVKALSDYGPQALACHNPAKGEYLVLRPRNVGILDNLEPEHSLAWCRLGLAFLHAYLLERLVVPKLCGGAAPAVQYIKAADDAARAAADSAGTAFLMQPTTMEEMRSVCGAGDLMPHKSTYFYPKLASGLIVNPLDN